MIYANFLFFIVAIASFTLAPLTAAYNFQFPFNLYGILLAVLGFWQFNRYRFSRIRADLDNETITTYEANRKFQVTLNLHFIIAIALFITEIFIFDLKTLIYQIPGVGQLEILANSLGVLVFVTHLVIAWFWAFHTMGDILSMGRSVQSYIMGNLKFNIAIIVPWLVFMAVHDIVDLNSVPMILQMGLFIFFLAVIAIISPLFIVRLWDCEPLEDSVLKQDILIYSESQGVRFKQIMSWNALNGSMVTAGVIGLLYPLRYLMITPELMRILNRDELLAVVSHEVGHVKRKHMLYYLLFFIGFMLLVGVTLETWLTSTQGIRWQFSMGQTGSSIFRIIATLSLFVLYFRFIFGFYSRNFERQADIHCFQSGIDPQHMLNSFMKLGGHVGDDGKKKNWHHYNLTQRVDFIRKSMENPRHIKEHHLKVKRVVTAFLAALIILTGLSIYSNGLKSSLELQIASYESALKIYIENNPENPVGYSRLGIFSYQFNRWEQSREAYEKSLTLEYRQPGVLNNLAWLYLKCPDKMILDPKRALELAKDAVKYQQAPHIFDTLAEAYFQNDMYEKAYSSAKHAYVTAVENFDYYKSQLAKMKKYYTKFKSSIKI